MPSKELLELFNLNDYEEVQSEPAPSKHLFLTISQAVVSGQDGPCTMRLMGHIQGQEVLIF